MDETRLEKLHRLSETLEAAIYDCDSKRDLAALARQYRETLKEIEGIEGITDAGDEISEIIEEVKTDGLPRAVRAHRS